ncbi:uncharacterized protein BDCG_04557 [Blastomyces dermatitidis ER-3]|uniref:N-acetyltransferase domain-containing protein n=1 Tax=Ajellomyces dermatitidis (strain ER-3 / ATCC MYA-2586) TaxID=559297 RepID=A0ABP2EYW5_AJEDR|nr:uncharacterized protein BDCG_04557 [Blastomyces dermatitidis ER-3]EEQ89437.1 hypothetical protein BDCG_04557 [Blastomyces dermatitidis ER-3]EQL32363.1 hypothetical protein BDFG_05490 [Blastomyces dermatitidis ATCC 26199]
MTSFKIERLTSPADAPVIGKIKTDAFETSTLSRYSFVWEGGGKAIVEKWYTDREEQDLQDPNQITIVSVPVAESTALDNGDDRASAGYPDNSHDRNSHHNNRNATGNTHVRTVAAWARFATPHPKPKDAGGSQVEPEYKKKKQYLMDNPPPGAHPELFTELLRQMVAGRKKYLDEEKDYVLELIATSPAFERQGHASRLLKWGIEKADAENARIFLEATPAGMPLYERLGWRTVDTIRIKLADYGIDAEGDGGGYALLHIMIRDPQGKTASDMKI